MKTLTLACVDPARVNVPYRMTGDDWFMLGVGVVLLLVLIFVGESERLRRRQHREAIRRLGVGAIARVIEPQKRD
jgi:hypothetical protein